MLTIIEVKGIHCASCGSLITEICLERPGVTSFRLDTATGRGEIEHSDEFDFNALVAELAANGGYVVTRQT